MRALFAAVAALYLCLSGFSPVPAADLVKVTVGTTGSASDAPLDIAIEKGYFRDQGLDVTLNTFDSAANMITLIGSGQLDIAAGNVSAGLFNAVERGIDLKIVASKSSEPKGYGYSSLLVRKNLWDSGKVRSIKDLRGLKVGEPALRSNLVEYALEKGGLTLRDVLEVQLSFGDLLVALTNGSLDAAMLAEPWVTKALEGGNAVRLIQGDVIAPDHMMTSIIYGGPFMKNKPDAAKKFMIAYLKGVRYYRDVLNNGHISGSKSDDVIAILTKYTGTKDPNIYRTITPNGVDPSGRVNMESLKRDLQFYKDFGLVKSDVTVEQAIDLTYVNEANKVLGPYRPAR
jgi:NitT/TauT family transport system substrate-binding protein